MTAIPEGLRTADIGRFAQRAAQLETARPIVAYWCHYWIVGQIISCGLHNADEASNAYTVQLMDKLEQTKQDQSHNDAITDDLAGQVYVEQFAQETFDRAEITMKANKVTRQTADTYLAAAVFLELGQIWGNLDAETTAKIKYAKFHALRIVKALKASTDPNESNPQPSEPMIDLQPSIEDVTDQDIDTASPRQNIAADEPDMPVAPVPRRDSEPLVMDASDPVPRNHLMGDASSPHDSVLPEIPKSEPAAPPTAKASPKGNTTVVILDDEEAAIAAAQKHAKWAISALAFEDVPTAVKELQSALRQLGA